MKRLQITLLAGTVLSGFGYSQDEPDTDEVFELSPFVVEGGEETGYRSGSTLAGTRLRTDLKDVGAAVSVYTEEFLKDISANSIEDILTYTNSTEGGGVNGNYSGITDESSDEVRSNPSGVVRVRSLATATRTRDYFASDIPSDSYNHGSVTINRGPNAILAGIGAAGGVIDVSLNKAIFKDTNSVTINFGDHGSHREQLNFNREVVEDVFAIRFDLLNEDREFQQKPAYEKDQRMSVAGTWRIRPANSDGFLGGTTVRAHYETGDIEGVPPDPLTPVLSVGSWFADDPSTTNPKWYVNAATKKYYSADGSVLNYTEVQPGYAMYRQWALVFSDPSSGEAGVGFTDPDLATVQGYQGVVQNPKGGFAVVTGDPNRNRAGYSRTRLMDSNVFDFNNQLMTGAFDYRTQDFDTLDLRLEQLFLGGKAGLELAFNEQDFSRFHDIPISGDNEIYIDNRKFLSIRNDEFPDGIPNPNYGRPMIITRDAFRDQTNDSHRKSYQMNAFFEHDFQGSESKWVRALGKHTFSGLLFETEIENENRTFGSTWYAMEGDTLDPSKALGADSGTYGRQVNAFFYIGDSVLDVDNFSDVRLEAISTSRPQFGQSYILRDYEGASGGFVTGTATPIRILKYARDNRETVESEAIAVQSRWLDNHLTTLLSWRRDTDASSSSVDPDELDDGTGGLDDSVILFGDEFEQSKESITKSAVLRLPKLPNVRLFWNESGNFNPVGLRRNVWNEELGSPAASTEEYGVSFSALDDKLSVRINRFDMSIEDAAVSGVNNPYGYINNIMNRMVSANSEALVPADFGYDHPSFETFEDVARAFYETIPARLRENMGPELNFNPRFLGSGDSFTWDPDGVTGYASTSDVRAKGTEVELVYNPTRSWRIMFNAAKNEAVKANVAAAELAYSAEWLSNLESMYDGVLLEGARNPSSEELGPFWFQYNQEVLSDNQTQAALSGSVTPEIRKYRANMVTNYSFREGALKGFSLGGAVRWEDKIAIGYPFIEDSEGNEIADIANPYWGPSQIRYDLNFAYGTKFESYGKKVDWTIRLFIGNIFGDDDLIPVKANADGTWGLVRIAPEKTWTLSNNFRF